jgi:hypothetical protein
MRGRFGGFFLPMGKACTVRQRNKHASSIAIFFMHSPRGFEARQVHWMPEGF